MADGEPVTQKQFYEAMKANGDTAETNQKEVITAINKQAVKTASLEATVVGHYTEFDKRINGNKKAIDKVRDRLWVIVGAGGASGALATIGLRVLGS